MPKGLRRFHEAGCLHFITFSCYHREPRLGTARSRDSFEAELERVRKWYGLYVTGYVVMPEHVHLLVSEPERSKLAVALQMLKQNVSRNAGGGRFWQVRYYDFLVWTSKKHIERLKYMHRNPVKRGLVKSPEDWKWSSFNHHATGLEGAVEIESQWTAKKREQLGVTLRIAERKDLTHPVAPKSRATRVGQPRNQK
jgi:putative transposase